MYLHSTNHQTTNFSTTPLPDYLYSEIDNGLPVAPHRLVSPAELEAADPLPLPYVLKPPCEGSSVGVSIIRGGDNRRAQIARDWTWGAQVMAEPFVPGREITVAVMGDRALAVTEIATHLAFYDYEAKYADGGSVHTLPAPIHPDAAAEAKAVTAAGQPDRAVAAAGSPAEPAAGADGQRIGAGDGRHAGGGGAGDDDGNNPGMSGRMIPG